MMNFVLNSCLTIAIAFASSGLLAAAKYQLTTTVTPRYTLVAGAKPEVVVVLFPGAFLQVKQYQEIAEEIVRDSDGTTAVLLASFFGNVSNAIEAAVHLKVAREYLHELGLSQVDRRLFIAGHSQGGITAGSVAAEAKVAGLILLGSYLPHTVTMTTTLANYPIPVLTLGAELDGLTGLNFLAREHATALSLVKKSQKNLLSVPVIVVRGANHMQFADGTAAKQDLNAELSLAEAHASFARVINNFIAVHQSGAERADSGVLELSAAFHETTRLVDIFPAARAEVHGVCSRLQRSAVSFAPETWQHVGIETRIYEGHKQALGFIFDKSSTKRLEDSFEIHIAQYNERGLDLFDVSADNYLGRDVIACKLRSQDMLAAETGYKPQGPATPCAQLNVELIRDSLSLITDTEQRHRLEDKHGAVATWAPVLTEDSKLYSRMRYGPFDILSSKKSTGQEWLRGEFSLQASGTRWQLTTAELTTGIDIAVRLFAGANYCKVLDPEQVIEWATIFSLR